MRLAPGATGVTGTGARFALLMVVVTASSIAMLDSVLMTAFSPGRVMQGPVGCLLAAGVDPGGDDLDKLLASISRMEPLRECLSSAPGVPFLEGMVATLVLLALAGLVYRLTPSVRDRWRKTLPVEAVDADGALAAELAALRERTGIRSQLRFRVDPARMTSGASAYGRTGRYTVCLHAGLLARRGTDPEGFRAVVLHELAHVHHRDVDFAYASTALWRVFVLLALLPYLFQNGRVLAIGLSGSTGSPYWPGTASMITYSVLSGLLLVALVHLARADLLRRRELHADVQAVAWGATAAGWNPSAPSDSVEPLLHRVTSLLRTHPGWAERRRVLADTAGLFRVSPLAMFLTGASASLLIWAAVPGLSGGPGTAWLTTALVAPVLCAALGLSIVRTSRTAAGHPESGVLPGLWLGCGLLVGELVNSGQYGVDWLLSKPAYLLVFLLIGAVPAVWWAQSVRLALGLPKRWQRRAAAPICAVVTLIVLWGGLRWWQLGGWPHAMGGADLGGALRTYVEAAPGPWHDYDVDLSAMTTGIPLLSPLHRNGLIGAAALAMWLLPLLVQLLLVRVRAGGAGLRLRRTLQAGLAGGAVSWAGLAVASYALHAGRPTTPAERLGAFQTVQMWWLVVTVLAACLLTAALVAAFSRRHWLLRALIASQVVQLMAYGGMLLLVSADGCFGPLNVIGGRCSWQPELGLDTSERVIGLTLFHAPLGAACAALVGAGAAWALRRLRGLPTADGAGIPAPAITSRRRPVLLDVGTVLVLALPAVLLTVLMQANAMSAAPSPNVRPGEIRDLTGLISSPPRARAAKIREWQAAYWLSKGGQARVRRINDAVRAVDFELLNAARQKPNKDGLVQPDEKAFHRVCGTLGKRVDAARSYFPVPDRGLRESWSEALRLLDRGARSCQEAMVPGRANQHATDAELSALFLQSLDDMRKGTDALRRTLQDITKRATTAGDSGDSGDS
ncbi:M48 family metalloprotease [Streptomyces halobius]|uniref:M48 family metalloprotease n=1 Tax=Streptomyces halobius TaxID=2879846 RepID=A0ABY4MI63_9ACTN|nr:M48 family metalloprotease [Streptomyces halobius]UQA97042.1 M48 family metalloprotease [Streptomyces halobius]